MEVQMHIVVLHGSPRKGMNSDTFADSFLKGIHEKANHTVAHFYLNDMNIRPCQGCFSCNSDHTCVINDDMQEIYREFQKAQIIVFATPMYWGYLTAQMKIAVDRLEALAGKPFHGKTFVVLITHRYHYQSTVAFFERVCPYFKVDLHSLVCKTLNSETDEDIPIQRCPDCLRRAYELGQFLGKRL